MDIQQRSAALRNRVTKELRGTTDPEARAEVLIAALYELSRSLLPELGPPGKSQEYLEGQRVVLELISSLAIALIKSPLQDRRGVAVLTEIGEGCLDPLLRKKFSIYAQELLAKPCTVAKSQPMSWGWPHWLLGLGGAAVCALYMTVTVPAPAKGKPEPTPAGLSTLAPPAPVATPPAANQPAAYPPVPMASADAVGVGGERVGAETEHQAQLVPEGRGAGTPAEQTTRVRIIDNQVLVPVILKNGGESVRVELVLDTGSTRTAIHEGLAARLRIDPRLTQASQSEVADGRKISSRLAKIDSLGVGPFAITSSEVMLIPYQGTEGIHDGLLGMDFLAKHRYQIDMEHERIRWF